MQRSFGLLVVLSMSRTKKSAAVRKKSAAVQKKIAKQKAKGVLAAKKRREAKQAAASESGGAAPEEGTRASVLAQEYLDQWTAREEGGGEWKFNKTRQVFLCKFWPDRVRVPGVAFKQLLLYMRSMPEGLQQRTIEQARKVCDEAESQEAEADAADAGTNEAAVDGESTGVDEALVAAAERKALLQIRRARALRVLQVLCEEEGA